MSRKFLQEFFSGLFGGKSGIDNLDAQSFEAQLKDDKDAVLVDVRTQAEHSGDYLFEWKLEIYGSSFRRVDGRLRVCIFYRQRRGT